MTHFETIQGHLGTGGSISPPRRIGTLVLASDGSIEADTYSMLPHGCVAHFSRMENYETCAARGTDHRSDLARSTRLLASCKDISAVIYGCTSGEVLHGRDFIEDAIRDTLSGAFVVTPLAAVVEALEMCSAQTISILSPYGDSLNRKLVELFENNGIAVEQVASPNEWRARDLSAIDILDLTTAASAMEFSRSGALFIPCNALSVVNVIDGIEASIDMTVLTSTQASVWKALQLLDQLGAQSLAKFGSIFSTVETPN